MELRSAVSPPSVSVLVFIVVSPAPCYHHRQLVRRPSGGWFYKAEMGKRLQSQNWRVGAAQKPIQPVFYLFVFLEANLILLVL